MSTHVHREDEFSLKSFFVPLTTTKAAMIIIIVGLIIFFNVFLNTFVGDDYGQIITNSFVHSVANIPTFFTSSTFYQSGGLTGIYYRPIPVTIFSIIYSLFGSIPFYFHFFQVSVFIANAVLVFILLKKFIRKELALLLALIFLVHPINEEVGVYISNLQDCMFFLFGMLALLFSMGKDSKYIHLKVFSMLVLSLLSKETGVVFVIINIVYELFFKKERVKETFIYSALLVAGYGILHYFIVGYGTYTIFQIGKLSMFERLLNIPAIIYFYLKTSIFPLNIAVSYDWVVINVTFKDFYLPLIVIIFFVSMIFLVLKSFKKNQLQLYPFAFFSIWFFIGLIPHLQLIPLDGIVATRWFYFSSLGLIGMIGIILENYIKAKKLAIGLYILILGIITILSIQTVTRNSHFKDNLTLACHDANLTHDNFNLETVCGGSLFSAGKYDDAQKHFETAVELAPTYGKAWWGLGITLGKKAEIYKSKELFNRAVIALQTDIKVAPDHLAPYESLSYLYANYEDASEARSFIKKALEKFPNDYILWQQLAIVEYKSGDKKEALNAIKHAYALNPNDQTIVQFYNSLTHNIVIKLESDILK